MDVLEWPLGRPDRLNSGSVANFLALDHLIASPKTAMHFLWNWGTKAKVSLMIAEPRDNHRTFTNFKVHWVAVNLADEAMY